MPFDPVESLECDAPDQGVSGPPRILDLSRSFSRIARPVATGIDRVERAYWAELSRSGTEVWALIRHGRYLALLDRRAADRMMQGIRSGSNATRFLGLAKHRLPARIAGQCGRLTLRARATAFGSVADVTRGLSARFPHGFDYLNVGHSNLDATLLTGLRQAGARLIDIKLHDMIPLDFPMLVRADTPEKFRNRTTAALTNADRIICNSAYTAGRVRHHARALGLSPRVVVAPLGVDVPEHGPAKPPPMSATPPYFLCVGTIEPRKNHALLLEVWHRLAAYSDAPPKLILVGARGWNNREVFDCLDSSPLMGACIEERGAVADHQMFDLLSGASGLLFPSLAEGYGLPALEAAALGVPVLCSDIEVFHEVLGDEATYLPADDPAPWIAAIGQLAARPRRDRHPKAVPTWDAHFQKVFGSSRAA